VRGSRWLIFAPVAILALFAPQANAEPIAGLNTTYYVIDEIPPTRSDNIYTVCGSEVENNINRSYDGEPYLDCTNDLFMVHMTGFIEIPVHDTIEFWLASDDGGIINIDGNEWGDWWDQGCTWMESGQIDISAGSQPLDLYMYENGGSSCLMLAWNINNEGWAIVPDEAFTTETSWDTTTSSTTTTTTTSTIAPSTTVPVVNVSTTTTPQTTSIPQPEPTMPEPPPTVPLPQIEPPAMPEIPDLVLPEIETYPPETLNLPPDTYPTIEPPDTLPFVEDPPDTMPLPPDTLPDAPETLDTLPIELIAELPPELVEALLDAGDSDIPLTEEQFDTVVDTIENLAPEEAVALITQILATAVTADQAEALASNPDVLAVITEEQATEIFETIEVAQLDETQIAELTAAIQDAPLAVQEAFEQTIDIFGGFDDYVPTGSNIPVGERRTLIAIAAGTTLTAAGTRMRRQ
jgi:hypothetical protein